jgi:hypothetical protein
MEMSQGKVVSIVFFILLIVIGGYIYTNIEYEVVQKKLPPSAEVRNNKYYAAHQLLKRSGLKIYAQSDYSLSHLPANATLLILNPEAMPKETQSLHLRRWIEQGGHLVFGVDNTAYYAISDELEIRINRRSANQCLKSSDKKSCRSTFTLDGAPYSADMKRLTPFSIKKSLILFSAASPINQERQIAARYQIGKGHVSVIQSVWLSNDDIADQQHAAILLAMVTLPSQERDIYLLERSTYPNLLSWLLDSAPYTLAALAAAMVLLLWHFMPRFGEMSVISTSQRPQLTEHLRAVGQYQAKHRNYDALITPLRNEVKTLLEPFKLYYPDIQNIEALLAHVTQSELATVSAVINARVESRQQFTQYVALLSQLIDKIKLAKQPNR